MARYYTLCQMTPSLGGDRIRGGGRRRRRAQFTRVYAGNPSGFIFHDSEKPLDIADIRHALHRLSSLHETGEADAPTKANKALALRVSANTLVASFSIAALPYPIRVQKEWNSQRNGYNTEEWLSSNPLRGWLIPDVRDPSIAAFDCNVNDLYSECTRLERLTDHCPCEMLVTGECRDTLVKPKVPKEFMDLVDMKSDFRLEYGMLRKVAYKVLPGNWALTSPKTTVSDDFAETVRPWDYHDFTEVEARQNTVSARAKARHSRAKHEKVSCNTCALVHRTYRGAVEHCGWIRDCTAPSTPEMAQVVLDGWLDNSGYLDMPGFTTQQRDYLIRLAGQPVMAKTFSAVRRVENIYAGFMRGGHNGMEPWVYQLVASGGPLDRFKQYETYRDLQAIIPDLPDNPECAPLDREVLYVTACYGASPRISTSGKPWYHRRLIKMDPVNDTAAAYIHTEGACSRYVSVRHSTHTRASYLERIRINPTIRAHQVPAAYREYLKDSPEKFRLPVLK